MKAVRVNESDSSGEEENEELLEGAIQAAELNLSKAKKHVVQYQIQREASNFFISVAKLDLTNRLPPSFQRKVLTIDMGQNLAVPNFAADQVGNVYYFSPLTVYFFGFVDNVAPKEEMKAYIWHEGEGNRDANNICSCLLKDFTARGYFPQKNYSSLTIIADNCGGQNKNKHVVCFLMWMVEMGYFAKITLLFLIKGHTKNARDRMFNILKLGYHRKDIFTVDQLCDVVNENEFIKVSCMQTQDFKDFLKRQDGFYRSPAAGSFNSTHVFEITSDRCTVLVKRDNMESESRLDSLLPTRRNRKAQLFASVCE